MRRNGFSLIEVMVTIVLVGLLAAMVIPYFTSGVTRSPDPINNTPAPLSVQGIMANIVEGYYSNPVYQHDLSQMSGSIVAGNYGLTAGHTITLDATFKFDPADVSTALKVTIKDNATSQFVTYFFTREM